MIGTVYNKKNRRPYRYISECVNATNDQSGQVMVLYRDFSGETFCREKSEFMKKFSLAPLPKQIKPTKPILPVRNSKCRQSSEEFCRKYRNCHGCPYDIDL